MQCGILSTIPIPIPIVGLCPVGFWPVGFCPVGFWTGDERYRQQLPGVGENQSFCGMGMLIRSM